jgi:hypothetical protein
VQAHRGPLPSSADGLEFLALAAPDKQWGSPEWRVPANGNDGGQLVWREVDPFLGDVVKLKVAITRVTQAF